MSNQLSPEAPPPSGSDGVLSGAEFHVLPRDLGSLFAKRPLIQGESEDEYDEFLSKVTSAVGPTDVIEAVWVKDIVDLIWEGQRLRRLKASLLMSARKEALMRLLDLNGPGTSPAKESKKALVHQWLSGWKAADKRLTKVLADEGLDLDSMMAQALSSKLRQVGQIDQMIASADARRNKVLAEIDRRRDTLARRLRTVAHDIIDVP